MISDKVSFNEELQFGSGDVLSDLFEHIGERKIIFIGDNAQLTPIKMHKSPALDKKYLERKYNIKVLDCELNEIMRQDHDSGILENAHRVRDNIFYKDDHKYLSEFGDVRFMEENDAITSCVNKFDPNKFSNFIVVTHTRKLSQQYNLSIRDKIYPKVESALVEGDRLVCAKTNYKHNVWNGELLSVIKVFDEEDSRISRYVKLQPTNAEKKYQKDLIEEDGRIHIRLDFQKAQVKYYDGLGRETLKSLYILENSLFSDNLIMSKVERRAHLVEFYMRFEESKKQYMERNNKTHLTESELENAIKSGGIINRDKDPFYNALICKYGYALTVHKAQGGEWETTVVDVNTKFPDTKLNEYLRWLYTALTRAKKNLYLVNFDGLL